MFPTIYDSNLDGCDLREKYLYPCGFVGCCLQDEFKTVSLSWCWLDFIFKLVFGVKVVVLAQRNKVNSEQETPALSTEAVEYVDYVFTEW